MADVTFPELSRFDRFGADTETTGTRYQDKPVGMGIATPDGNKVYLAWGHRDGGNNCSIDEVRRWARAELRDPAKKSIWFNAQFDLRMLRKVGVYVDCEVHDAGAVCSLLDEHEQDTSLGGRLKRYLNREKSDKALNQYLADRYGGKPTREVQASRYWWAPGDVVAPYGSADAQDTLDLWDLKHPELSKPIRLSRHPGDTTDLTAIYQLEMEVIPVLVNMYLAGVPIDVARVHQVRNQLREQQVEAQARWEAMTEPDERNVMSGPQLAKLFDRLGLLYPRNKPTAKMLLKNPDAVGNPSFKKEFLLSLDHDVGKLIRSLRQFDHYIDTFIGGYILANLTDEELIHPNFWPLTSDFGGTITGRFSSSGGLNAQNIPSRDDVLAPLIRSMFRPKTPDHQWLKADYSQIEYRLLAHYAGGQLKEAYRQNPHIDFHDMVAAMTGLPRKAAKNINFAKVYGAGAAKLAMTIGCSLEQAKQFIEQYDQRVPEASRAYYRAMNLGDARGFMMTWGGRICRFQPRRDERGRFRWDRTYTALNKVLQGSAADLIKKAMVEVNRAIDWRTTIMHLTVHDELDFSIPRGDSGLRVARDIKDIMEGYQLEVPIIAELELGPNWGHTTKLKAEDFAAVAHTN